jgi:hypothetical protein
MNSTVAAIPSSAACHDASIAAFPNVGPTVRCSRTSTGTGSAPARISNARSFASAMPKLPVITVDPPAIPMSQVTVCSTCGDEMTLSSRTYRSCRRPKPSASSSTGSTRSR